MVSVRLFVGGELGRAEKGLEIRTIYGKQMSSEGKRKSRVLTKWHKGGHCKTPDPDTHPNAWCEVVL